MKYAHEHASGFITGIASQVDATRSGLAPREFNATLNTYQYGDICFAATPPAGQVGKENSNPGLPAVSDPGRSFLW